MPKVQRMVKTVNATWRLVMKGAWTAAPIWVVPMRTAKMTVTTPSENIIPVVRMVASIPDATP